MPPHGLSRLGDTRAELDLLLVRGGAKVGFEIKRTVAPHVTRSARSARKPWASTACT
jgi:hypothetical protein